MKRAFLSAGVVLLPFAFAACGSRLTASEGTDAGPAVADTRPDVTDASPEVAAEAAIETGSDGDADTCPSHLDGGTCAYGGYGTPCHVACSVPAGCRFALNVEWSGGGYCCGGSPFDRFDACACSAGEVLCNSSGEPGPPKSSCEFCNRDTGPGD